MPNRRTIRGVAVFIAVASLICTGVVSADTLSAAGYASWLRKPVFFSLDEEALGKFLLDFSNRQGMPCFVSPKIIGTVSGKFGMPDSGALLSLIAKTSGIQWYYDGGRVFYYAGAEIENASIPLRSMKLDALKELLTSMGAYDPRFDLRAVQKESETILYVNAPPRYIQIIRELTERFDIKPKGDKTMRLFRLRHAWARDQKIRFSDGEQIVPGVATTLQQIVTADLKNSGVAEDQAKTEAKNTIMPDMRLNAVIVWETNERMGYFETLIRDLDQETELVEIRAAIVDVGVDHTKELGLGWGYERKDGKAAGAINLLAGRSLGGDSEEGSSFASELGSGMNAYTILGGGINQFMIRIHALQDDGNANVLSRPTVLTADNVQATIERTETFYVRLEAREAVQLEEVTYGTKLIVTPHIIAHPDGRRRIQMMVEVSDGAATDTGEVDNIPRTVNSVVTTQAVVGEGQALVIGGHYSEVLKDSKKGVPILSRLPGVGALFRTNRKDATRYERLFVISPRIIKLGELADASAEGMNEAFNNSVAQPVFRNPSASDSLESIRARFEEEKRAMQEGAGEEITKESLEQRSAPAGKSGNGAAQPGNSLPGTVKPQDFGVPTPEGGISDEPVARQGRVSVPRPSGYYYAKPGVVRSGLPRTSPAQRSRDRAMAARPMFPPHVPAEATPEDGIAARESGVSITGGTGIFGRQRDTAQPATPSPRPPMAEAMTDRSGESAHAGQGGDSSAPRISSSGANASASADGQLRPGSASPPEWLVKARAMKAPGPAPANAEARGFDPPQPATEMDELLLQDLVLIP